MRVLSIAVFALSLMLVTVGSVISSSGYGISIPDWPLALGSLIPDPLVAGIAWEFTHRVLSLITGLATLLLGGGLLTTADALQRRLGTAMMAIILVQIVLGGLGVLQEFPWLLKVMHASLAHLFVGTAAAAVALLSTGGVPASDQVADPAAIRRTRAFASMVLLQLVAGRSRQARRDTGGDAGSACAASSVGHWNRGHRHVHRAPNRGCLVGMAVSGCLCHRGRSHGTDSVGYHRLPERSRARCNRAAVPFLHLARGVAHGRGCSSSSLQHGSLSSTVARLGTGRLRHC